MNNTPIIYIDYVTRKDQSQYNRIEYENGCIETTPRDVWVAAHPSDQDSWKSGPRGMLFGAEHREYEKEML